ncbi:MAG TPA: hypothetical protein ENJ59_01825 [Thermofilum sp.]|nr:hypothetical protein [Thermofilum sp.]
MENAELLLFKIMGIGCASCVVPAKEHFLKVEGVLGVFAYGNKVSIIYDPTCTSQGDILEKSRVQEYYLVEIVENKTGSYDKILEELKSQTIRNR